VALVVCDGDYPVKNPQSGIWSIGTGARAIPSGDLRVFDQYADTLSYDTMKQDQFAKFAKYNGFCEKKTNVPCDSSSSPGRSPADRRLGRLEAGQPQPGAGDHRAPDPQLLRPDRHLVYVDYVEYAA